MYVIKRRGFAMIMAIFILVLIALGGTMLLSKGSAGSKSGSKRYLHTQAELLAKSAKEYAILRIQGFDTAGGDCLNQLDITVNSAGGTPMYNINISMLYAFNGPAPVGGTCNFLAQNTGRQTTVQLDIVVTDQNVSDEEIRVHDRSWQVF